METSTQQTNAARDMLAAALLCTLISGCASSSAPEPTFDNPPQCAATVARHDANPTLAVDSPAQPRSIQVFSMGTGRYVLRLRVDAAGRVAPDGISIEPTPPNAARVTRLLAASAFTPARSGACWVASVFTYTLTFN